jgi:hypothetical protein
MSLNESFTYIRSQREILQSLHEPHPTPSLPFRVVDEQDDVAPNYDVNAITKPESMEQELDSQIGTASGGAISRIGYWLLETLMEMDGQEMDAYEGLQGKIKGRPPKWRYRWDANGNRLPPEIKD